MEVKVRRRPAGRREGSPYRVVPYLKESLRLPQLILEVRHSLGIEIPVAACDDVRPHHIRDDGSAGVAYPEFASDRGNHQLTQLAPGRPVPSKAPTLQAAPVATPPTRPVRCAGPNVTWYWSA